MASKSRLVKRLFENWPAKVIALAVAVVVVLLNDIAGVGERYFSIPLELKLPESLVPGEPYSNRVRVTLRGDEDEIFRVLEDDISAFADFTEHERDGVYRAPISLQKQGTALDVEALEIAVEPLTITVTLEEKLISSIEVVPNLIGFPPPGYELTDYRLTPTQVAVVGPRSRLEGITSILTEEIDLARRQGDFSERIRLVKPDELLDFPGGEIVDFRALITETVVQSVFEDVEITIVDLDPAFRVASLLPTGTIHVQAKELDLEGIADARVSIIVDASDVSKPGIYELPTRPQIPSGILVLGIDPAKIELVIEDRLSPEEGAGQ